MPEIGATGLTSKEVAQRIESGQSNAVKTSTSRSVQDIVRANVFTLFNGIIFAAMVLVLITGSWRDAVFGFVIIINTGIGIVTELRAKRTLDKLSILVASEFLVRRDGKDVEVSHNEIVLDDLLWIRAGEQVPADGQIIQTWGLELDESMLTGESRTVRHKVGEQVYSGATAVSGMALVKVNAVGSHSYAATLTAQAKVYKKTVSDLNKGINTILKFMTFLVVPLCILLILSQIHTVGGWGTALSTGEWRQAVVSAVAGVVGMIPEGLVLLTSLNFAVAAMRLARHNTLVQELESVETLARVDALNLDKTGTITDGGIAFNRLVMLGSANATAEQAATQSLYDCCNEEQPNGTGQAVLAGLKAQGYGAGAVESRVPFSSARKWSAVRKSGETWYMGAPEVIISALEGDYSSVLQQVNEYANDGNRVLLVARSTAPLSPLRGQLPSERGAEKSELASLSEGSCRQKRLRGAVEGANVSDDPQLDPKAEPVALVLCSEKIREDAERTLAWFREQGVRCRVISGDNPVTVGAIARRVKLTGDHEPVAMDARELPEDVNELARVLENVDVLGRVLPDQKKAIVQALHTQNHVVAMTGDGVNDAPSIKSADIGVGMGITGTEVTKQSAKMILADDNFSTIVAAVREGRVIFDNIRKFLRYLLSSNVGEVFTVFLGVVFAGFLGIRQPETVGVTVPLLATQLLWINLLTDAAPALAMGVDPQTDDVMGRKPRKVTDRVIDASMWGDIIYIGVIMAIVTLIGMDMHLSGGLFTDRSVDAIGHEAQMTEARTMGFTILVFAQLFNALSSRSHLQSAFVGLFSNKWLWGAIGLSVALQLVVIYVPFLNGPFGTVALSPMAWVECICLCTCPL